MGKTTMDLVFEELRAIDADVDAIGKGLRLTATRLTALEMSLEDVQRGREKNAERVGALGTRFDRLADDVALVRNRLGMAD